MNDMALRIQKLFPSADLQNKVLVQDDGNGPYIKQWDNTLGAQPTEAQLLAVDVREVKSPAQLWSDWQAMSAAVGQSASSAVWKQLLLTYFPELSTKDKTFIENSEDGDMGPAGNHYYASLLVQRIHTEPAGLVAILQAAGVEYDPYVE